MLTGAGRPAAIRSANLLPDGAFDELRRLIETYERLRSRADAVANGADAEIDVLKKRLEARTSQWTDLGEAVLCTIGLLEDVEVRAHLVSWRRRMHEVIGDTRYASYLASAADPNAKTTDSPMLRADLAECINTVDYFYGAYGVAASSRAQVTKSLIAYALVILAGLALFGFFIALAPRIHIVLPVLALEYMLATSAAAVVGCVISVQRRLQDPSIDVDPFYRYIQSRSDQLSITFISVLFGAVFGMTVYLLLLSGLLGGSAFPQINADGIPNPGKDVALLLIYGFLAGFAEQLIPDTLTRIAARTINGIVGAPSTTPMADQDFQHGKPRGLDAASAGAGGREIDTGNMSTEPSAISGSNDNRGRAQ
jgi:hypothetical protein